MILQEFAGCPGEGAEKVTNPRKGDY